MPENTYSLEKTVMALWEKKRISSLRDLLLTLQPVQVAGLFRGAARGRRARCSFRLLPKETAAEVFVELDAELQAALIRGLTDVELKAIVEEISMDDAADIVEEMPANVVHRILEQASPEARRTINELLKYPEDSAGSIMTTEFVSLHATDTVAEAIALIRRTGNDQETVDLTLRRRRRPQADRRRFPARHPARKRRGDDGQASCRRTSCPSTRSTIRRPPRTR